MFDNLTKEIIYYSFIPVVVLFVIGFIILILKRKNTVKYKSSYAVRVILLIIDSLVLSLIIGYSIWAISRFIHNSALSSNMLYVVIFAILIISLIVLMTVTAVKLYRSFNNEYEAWYDEEENAN